MPQNLTDRDKRKQRKLLPFSDFCSKVSFFVNVIKAFPRGEGGTAKAVTDEGWRARSVRNRSETYAKSQDFRPHSSSVSLRSTASPGEALGAPAPLPVIKTYNFL